MAKYLIDGATLTAIANKIREKAPEAWGDDPITPEYMPSGVECAYDDGWDAGYNAGKAASGSDLEALGALCEWHVIIDSDLYAAISVRNKHPSYYLHCRVSALDTMSGGGGSFDMVVPPNSSKSEWLLDVGYGAEIDVTNVRWKKSAT